MDVEALAGEFIGLISISGGLSVGAYAIYQGFKDRRLQMENISKERLLLIEKGLDPSLAHHKLVDPKTGSKALFWGLTLSGLGIGITLGNMIARAMGFAEDKISLAMALLFTGLGMVTYYIYTSRMNAKKAD